MSTNRSFQTMLNEYLTYDLLKEEFMKRDYLFSKVEKDDGWKGGNLVVPFKAAGASSVAFGQLSASTDISEDNYVRGGVSTYKEVWGSMIFNHRDLLEHDGKVNEKSFLKILPDAVEDFMDWMKMAVSINMLNGPAFDSFSADGLNTGITTVNHPDRYNIGQKVVINDTVPTGSIIGYVASINMNTSKVAFVTTRGGSTALDLSAYTLANGSKVYFEGAQTDSFTSLKLSLLPASAGGSTSLYGVQKTLYPYTQAIAINGSTITQTNILTQLFNGYTTVRRLGKGNPNEAVMSYKNFGAILTQLESTKGAFNIVQGSMKVNVFGWTEVNVIGVKGELKMVAIQEMDDDVIMLMDWRAVKFHSNGMFRKRTAPDGKQYFEQRGTNGYQYILDMSLFGELVLNRPSYCGIIYSISYVIS